MSRYLEGTGNELARAAGWGLCPGNTKSYSMIFVHLSFQACQQKWCFLFI